MQINIADQIAWAEEIFLGRLGLLGEMIRLSRPFLMLKDSISEILNIQ